MNQNSKTEETLQPSLSYKDYSISFYEYANLPFAKLYKIMKGGKSKGLPKLQEHISFRSAERRQQWAEQTLKIIKERYVWSEEKEKKQSYCNENFLNPYKVGEVFYRSWGYEQTNIDFYMITKLLSKSVIVQKIGQIVVEGSEGFMCENVKPNPSAIIGEPELKKIRTSLYCPPNGENEINYSIGLSKYTNGENGVYQSHYA